MIETYIKSLKAELNRYELSNRERSQMVSDTLKTIETLKQTEQDEAAIIEQLPSIQSFKQTLSNSYPLKDRLPMANFLNRVIFFGGILAFFIAGFFFSAWHPAWIVFILMPILIAFVELLNDPDQPISSLISVFGGVVAFGVLAFITGVHPAWVLLLLIPAGPIYNSKNSFTNQAVMMALLTPLLTIPITVVFVYLERQALPILTFNLLVLLPLHHIKHHPRSTFLDITVLTTIGLTIMLSYTLNNPLHALYALSLYLFIAVSHRPLGKLHEAFNHMSLYVFILCTYLIILTLYLTVFTLPQAFIIIFIWPILWRLINRKSMALKFLIAPIILGVYYGLGVFLNIWHPTWLIIVLIPILKTLVAVKK